MLKEKIKAGYIIIDDCNLIYKVVDVFENSAAVTTLDNERDDIACEVMSFAAMENEGWWLPNIE